MVDMSLPELLAISGKNCTPYQNYANMIQDKFLYNFEFKL